MDRVLAGYVRALRAAGSEASTAETIDAARAVALIGYADRSGLKTALGMVLAKSVADLCTHERVFDLYFGTPGSAALQPAASSGLQADATRAAAAVAHLPGPAFAPTGGDATSGTAEVDTLQMLQALAAGAAPGASPQAADALQLALARAAADAGVDGIRLVTQVAPLTRSLLQRLGLQVLDDRLLQQLTADTPAARAEAAALQATRAALQQAAKAFVEHAFELYGRPATESFMTDVAVHRSLGRMAPEDMQRLRVAVARMARKLADRHARRQRVRLRGALDMRRTLRANAGQDSVPTRLVFRHRRRDRPRLVVVCDVSGSVAAQVRFLLMFLYALHGLVGDLRSFAFSNALLDIGKAMETLPFDDAMAWVLQTAGMGSTDYGQAFADLHAHHLPLVDRRTTLLVLGDGRSNGTNPRLDCFAELAQRAKRVLWLCPEAESRWGSGDSELLRYRPWCTASTHCATVADLERALDEALAAYR